MLRKQLSNLFTEKFFSLTEIRQEMEVMKPSFSLPSASTEIPNLLNNETQWNSFKTGVESLLSRLEKWGKQNHIQPEEGTIEAIIAHFLETNFSFPKQFQFSPSHQQEIFHLYSEGICFLTTIVNILESEKISRNVCQYTISALFDGLKCAPGSYTNLYDACLALQSNPQAQLLNARRKIAEQLAQSIIHAKKVIEGHVGDEIHYVNAILNYFEKQIGIELISDIYAPQHIEVIQPLLEEFEKQIPSALTPLHVIEELVRQLDLEQLAKQFKQSSKVPSSSIESEETQKSNIEKLTQFCQSLDIYGVDSQFKRYHLIDPEHVDQLRDDASAYLRISLMERLASRNYLDLTPRKTIEITQSLTLYLYPDTSLMLAYVCDSDPEHDTSVGKIPLLSYLETCCLENNYQTILFILARFETQKHLNEAISAIIHIIAREMEHKAVDERWLREQVNFLQKPLIKDSLQYIAIATWLNFLRTIPREKRKDFLSLRDNMRLIDQIQTIEELVGYMVLFPMEDQKIWKKIQIADKRLVSEERILSRLYFFKTLKCALEREFHEHIPEPLLTYQKDYESQLLSVGRCIKDYAALDKEVRMVKFDHQRLDYITFLVGKVQLNALIKLRSESEMFLLLLPASDRIDGLAMIEMNRIEVIPSLMNFKHLIEVNQENWHKLFVLLGPECFVNKIKEYNELFWVGILVDFLEKLSENKRVELLTTLDKSFLNDIYQNIVLGEFARILNLLPLSNQLEFLKSLDKEILRRKIKTFDLNSILFLIPKSNHSPLLTYLAEIFEKEDWEEYQNKFPRNYELLSRYRKDLGHHHLFSHNQPSQTVSPKNGAQFKK